MIEIKKATAADIPAAAMLANRLWPHHEATEMEAEYAHIPEDANASIFLAFQDRLPVGFAQCSLRYDYVEGTCSSPVGYLEGIYVLEAYRSKGIAGILLKSCEKWAKEQGCSEFASDCELSNTQSLNFHLSVGFDEANRIICFTKRI